MVVAMLYIGLDLAFMFFEGFNSSSWLHVGGAMLGAPLAIAMLKRGVVDCEKWDIFHVLRDDQGGLDEKRRREDPAELAKLKEQRDSKILDEGKTQLQKFMVSGYYLPAFALYQKLQDVGEGIELSRGQLLKMVTALHQEKRWRDSCPLMAEWVERFPEQSQEVKVKLAQICVLELQKPGRALDLLTTLDLQRLSPKALSLVKKIALRAKHMQAEGVVELDDEAW